MELISQEEKQNIVQRSQIRSVISVVCHENCLVLFVTVAACLRPQRRGACDHFNAAPGRDCWEMITFISPLQFSQ